MNIFYVYQFRIKKHGLFYIGVTNDIEKRKRQHWCEIHAATVFYVFDVYANRRMLPVHSIIGHELSKDKKISEHVLKNFHYTRYNFLNATNYIRPLCTFKIIDIKDTWQEAAELETSLLWKHNGNPKFLNYLKTSSYAFKLLKKKK